MSSERSEDQGSRTTARMLELLVRLQVHGLKGERNQTEMILLLNSIGFTTGEIVSFLGVPRATAAPIISKAKNGKGAATRNRGKKK